VLSTVIALKKIGYGLCLGFILLMYVDDCIRHADVFVQVQLLSPVPTEFNESSQLIESLVVEEPSFQQFGYAGSVITSLKDEVNNRFTAVGRIMM
jgi:hypothetical protein